MRIEDPAAAAAAEVAFPFTTTTTAAAAAAELGGAAVTQREPLPAELCLTVAFTLDSPVGRKRMVRDARRSTSASRVR